jgi:hypothetical protein
MAQQCACPVYLRGNPAKTRTRDFTVSPPGATHVLRQTIFTEVYGNSVSGRLRLFCHGAGCPNPRGLAGPARPALLMLQQYHVHHLN